MPTIAQVKQQVDRIWYATFQSNLTSSLASELRRQALLGVKAALEAALVEELEAHRLSFRDQRHTAHLQRSGTYTRRILTAHGFIPDLRIPKLRGLNRLREWLILHRYQLAMPLLLDQALYLYTLGLSIRDLQEALYVLFGRVLSREAINRVTLAAQSPLEEWRTQQITDTPPILIVDGVWGQVLAPTGATFLDQSGHERREMRGQDQVILTVMGVWPDGRHQIIHYEPAAAEDSVAWTDLLVALKRRGLKAETVEMVVSDGSTGLPKALAKQLPNAKQQRCVVHKIRGLERAFCYRTPPTHDPITREELTHEAARRQRRQQLSTDAHAIFEAPTLEEAKERLALFRTTWSALESEVVRLLNKDVDACLTFYHFEQKLHALVRSTNLLERFFREYRTKSDEIGAFPNQLSSLVVFHLIVIRDDAKHDRARPPSSNRITSRRAAKTE
jgi:transposase-like protein